MLIPQPKADELFYPIGISRLDKNSLCALCVSACPVGGNHRTGVVTHYLNPDFPVHPDILSKKVELLPPSLTGKQNRDQDVKRGCATMRHPGMLLPEIPYRF